MKRLAVLISGGGSNLQALIDATAAGTLAAEIALVISNRTEALGLERARRAGIATLVLPLQPWLADGQTRTDYDINVAKRIAAAGADLVVLAGWMHILGPGFLSRLVMPIINLHPALPGMFPGNRAIERALEAFGRGEIAHTGVMVHRVVPEIDAGPVLGTAPVPIEPGDDIATLSTRMHAAEHKLLVDVVRGLLANG